MTVDAPCRHDAAEHAATHRLVVATWALVAATIILVAMTALLCEATWMEKTRVEPAATLQPQP
jgi:hypothetical protein